MSSWRATLRIARRDARRAKGRSALVIAMIALPVLGVVAIDVVVRTDELSPEQSAARTMGQADAVLFDSGYTSVPQFEEPANGVEVVLRPDGGEVDVVAALPTGSRVLSSVTLASRTVSAGDRTTRGELRDLDITDPIAVGLYTPTEGRAPAGDDEAALTTAFADRLGVGVGDRVEVDEPQRSLTVVGLVRGAQTKTERTLLVAPGTLPEPPSAGGYGAVESTQQLVDVPGPLDLSTVLALNAEGLYVEPRVPVPGAPVYDSAVQGEELAVVGLVVGMALLEVVLLAGPAFAVGAKRQARQLALLSATGGEKRDVRRTVLGAGLVLGGVAAVAGAVGGVALGAAVMAAVARYGTTYTAPLDVRPVEVLGIALVGVVTALLAAVLPARTAAKQDVVAALTGRRGVVRTSRLLTAAGVVAVIAGALLALQGARSRDVVLLLSGSIVAELGLVATTPALVGLAGRLGPRLPVGPRLALRDASRNRSRTAPAVAAILAAVAGTVAVGTYVTSLDRYDEQRYEPVAALGTVVQYLDEDARPRAAAIEQAVRTHLPVDDVLVLSSFSTSATDGSYTDVSAAFPPKDRCPLEAIYLAAGSISPEQEQASFDDPRCNGELYSEVYGTPSFSGASVGSNLVGGPEVLPMVLGTTSPELAAALETGGVVAPARLVHGGVVSVQVSTGDGSAEPPDLREVELPAVALPDGADPVVVLGPAAAAALELEARPRTLVSTVTRVPTSDEEDRLLAALRQAELSDVSTYVERGYQSNYGLGLVALAGGSALLVLGASGIATGLAAADGRADLSTLAAVGATPGLRRRLAAFQSAVTAGLGTLLGVAAGLVPALGLIGALNSSARAAPGFAATDLYPVVVPWALLAVTVLVVPVLAALAAGLLTRSRLPLVRRPA